VQKLIRLIRRRQHRDARLTRWRQSLGTEGIYCMEDVEGDNREPLRPLPL
jgi:hypothetical protein